jgi:anti-sigma factor RsiW
VTCQDAITILADYLESTLSASVVAELETHLADCPACVAYLNTYKRTRDVAAKVAQVEMPEEMRERLRAFLLARLNTS